MNIPETSPLRMKSCFDLAARNTSASSSNKTQPHRLASVKCVSRAASTSEAVVPRSPDSGLVIRQFKLVEAKWRGAGPYHR
jgi:hypothetical protein